MRLIHTSDWHVGVLVGGRDRTQEHAVFLEELFEIVREEKIDAVLVAGDIFDHPNPTADSEKVVLDFFVKMREIGVAVVFIAGNHDSGARIEGKARLLECVNVHAFGKPQRQAGVEIQTRSGDPLRVAALPFAGEARLLDWEEAGSLDQGGQKTTFAEKMRGLLSILAAEHFRAGAVNILMAHLTVDGALLSGTERNIRMSDAWTLPASMLPSDGHYLALGHIHKHQVLSDLPMCAYSGSPLYIDFGEEKDEKGIYLLDARPDRPVHAEFLKLSRITPLKTLHVPLKKLQEATDQVRGFGGHLKVVVSLGEEDKKIRVAEEVRRALPQALMVRVDSPKPSAEAANSAVPPAHDPIEAYKFYLESQNRRATPELVETLRSLIDEVHRAPSSP